MVGAPVSLCGLLFAARQSQAGDFSGAILLVIVGYTIVNLFLVFALSSQCILRCENGGDVILGLAPQIFKVANKFIRQLILHEAGWESGNWLCA